MPLYNDHKCPCCRLPGDHRWDAGPATLRQAVVDANAVVGRDTIDVTSSLDTIYLSTYADALGINHLSLDDTLVMLGHEVVFNTQDCGRFFQINAFVIVHDVTFNQATAAMNGNAGACWVNDHAVFENCLFGANNAPNTGGAILINTNGAIMPLDTADVRFVSCTFDSNSSGVSGGAMYVRIAKLLLENCCFINNSSLGTAPNIFNNQGIITLTGIIKFDGSTPHIINGATGEVILDVTFSVPLGSEFLIE